MLSVWTVWGNDNAFSWWYWNNIRTMSDWYNYTTMIPAILMQNPIYTSSTLFQDALLSLTDSDFAYKIDLYGISTESKGIWTYPKLTLQGINANQSGLTQFIDYYLSWTPWALTSTYGANLYVGTALSTTQLQLIPKYEVVIAGTTYTLVNLTTSRTNWTGTYAKVKEVQISKNGTYTVTYNFNTSNSSYYAYAKLFINWVLYDIEKSIIGNGWPTVVTYNLPLNKWDIVNLWLKQDGSHTYNAVTTLLSATYNIMNKYQLTAYNSID